MEKVEVSIIIPTYNRKEDLNKCIESVLHQTFKNYEVKVIDDNSSDGSQDFISNKYSFIKLIINKYNKGPSFAKNQGILMSKSKYLWFLDSDSIVINKNCLKNMYNILQNNPNIGAIGGEIYINDSYIKINKLSPSCHSKCLSTNKNVNLLDVDYIATSNFFVKKSLITDIGGFDTNFLFTCEDTDASLKIKKRGYRMVIDTRLAVFHKISMEGRNGNLLYHHKNRVRLALLHFNLKHILLLPFYELVGLFEKRKLEKIEKYDADIMKCLNRKSRMFLKNKSYFIKTMIISFYYFPSLLYAYFYNLIILPKTIYIRFKKPSFLK